MQGQSPALPFRFATEPPAETECCVVGGGPAGMVLGYLLARAGVDVTVLESHLDFDREFRGDTLHPSSLEMLDELGLADKLLEESHTRLHRFVLKSATDSFVMADFTHLKTKFPFVALIAQVKFLNLLATEAEKFPHFHLVMGAAAKDLLEEEGVCRGVRCQTQGGVREIRAPLTVAADGRHSVLRKKAGFEPHATSAPMDVVWFKLPRRSDDAINEEASFRAGVGHATVVLNRGDCWQIALVIQKGGFSDIKKQGIEHFRQLVTDIIPELSDRIADVHDFSDVSVLVVESTMLERWHRPGLLFIGDAAHAMSPVGGVGINYAIQDAIEAANVLVDPLRRGTVDEDCLGRIQARRQGPVRFMQRIQSLMQKNLVARTLDASRPFKAPFFSRFTLFRRTMGRLLAFGIHTAELSDAFDEPAPHVEADLTGAGS